MANIRARSQLQSRNSKTASQGHATADRVASGRLGNSAQVQGHTPDPFLHAKHCTSSPHLSPIFTRRHFENEKDILEVRISLFRTHYVHEKSPIKLETLTSFQTKILYIQYCINFTVFVKASIPLL